MACDIVAPSQRGGNQLGSAGGLAEYQERLNGCLRTSTEMVPYASGSPPQLVRRTDAGGMAE